jgi:hypothetical protein
MVSQIHKTEIAQISLAVNPPRKLNFLVDVRTSQFAAGVSTIAVHKKPHFRYYNLDLIVKTNFSRKQAKLKKSAPKIGFSVKNGLHRP